MRMRKKRNLDERLEKCAEITKSSPEIYKNVWKKTFYDSADSLCVEIGCGKGRFITDMAKANPNRLYIAIEREKSAVVTAMEKTISDGINNLFFIVGDAENICEIFGYGEVDELYINFCDPWTGNKHAKRRLTHHNFLALYRHILRAGGSLFFKTDNRDLFHFSVAEMREFGLELIGVTEDLHNTDIPNIMTEYEEKFSSQGVPINRLEAKFPDTPAAPILSKDERRVLHTTQGTATRGQYRSIILYGSKDQCFEASENMNEDCIVDASSMCSTDVFCTSQKIDIPVVVATGYSYDVHVGDDIRELSRDQIARKMINDLMIGIENTNIKAGYIKVAATRSGMTDCEEKILKAACRAAKATGSVIMSHTETEDNMKKQLEIVEAFKLSPSRLIWMNSSNKRNAECDMELAEKGCYIGFDITNNESADRSSIAAVKVLIDEGYIDKVLIRFTCDICKSSTFIQKMKDDGVTDNNIEKIFSDNPFNAFAR